MIFGDGGLYTFDLVKKQDFTVEGGYFGRIGHCSDVKIVNFKIEQGGITGTAEIDLESYDITGKMNGENSFWSGFI